MSGERTRDVERLSDSTYLGKRRELVVDVGQRADAACEVACQVQWILGCTSELLELRIHGGQIKPHVVNWGTAAMCDQGATVAFDTTWMPGASSSGQITASSGAES